MSWRFDPDAERGCGELPRRGARRGARRHAPRTRGPRRDLGSAAPRLRSSSTTRCASPVRPGSRSRCGLPLASCSVPSRSATTTSWSCASVRAPSSSRTSLIGASRLRHVRRRRLPDGTGPRWCSPTGGCWSHPRWRQRRGRSLTGCSTGPTARVPCRPARQRSPTPRWWRGRPTLAVVRLLTASPRVDGLAVALEWVASAAGSRSWRTSRCTPASHHRRAPPRASPRHASSDAAAKTLFNVASRLRHALGDGRFGADASLPRAASATTGCHLTSSATSASSKPGSRAHGPARCPKRGSPWLRCRARAHRVRAVRHRARWLRLVPLRRPPDPAPGHVRGRGVRARGPVRRARAARARRVVDRPREAGRPVLTRRWRPRRCASRRRVRRASRRSRQRTAARSRRRPRSGSGATARRAPRPRGRRAAAGTAPPGRRTGGVTSEPGSC